MEKHEAYISKNRQNRAFFIVSVLAFISMLFLFYAQSIRLNNQYDSDFFEHIEKALKSGGTGYSLNGKIIVWLNSVFSGNTLGISLFLALVVSITPLAVAFMLSQIDSMSNGCLRQEQLQWIGLWSIFTGPIVIPCLWPWFYKNTMNINAWHNSTSMEMRLFSVLAFAFYIRVQHQYLSKKHIQLKDWIGLTVCLLLSAWFKPSFFVGFAPIMAIELLLDLKKRIKKKGELKNVILLGLSAVPAGIMVILQYMKLYGWREDVSLSINNSQDLGLFFTRIGLFLIIPIIVLLYNRRMIIENYRKGDRLYFQILGLWLFEVIYHLLLTEVGRSGGNFGWGVRIGNFFLAVISLKMFCNNLMVAIETVNAGEKVAKKDLVYICLTGFLFIWQFGCGIWYYIHLLLGGSFYI